MPLSALEQIQRLIQPARPPGYLRGLRLARDMVAGKEVAMPKEAPEGFLAGMQLGHDLVQEHGDPDVVLLLIDDFLLRAFLDRL